MRKNVTASALDLQVVEIIKNYGWGAMGAMVAIPVPGADLGATAAVWGKMIHEIAKVYGHSVQLEDAKRLASDLFKSVILTTAAWFASAKTASFLLKFIPGAGTVTAYVIDALVAGIGAKGITSRLGTAAALYYKSGKRLAPETLADHVKNVAADPWQVPPHALAPRQRSRLADVWIGDCARPGCAIGLRVDDPPSNSFRSLRCPKHDAATIWRTLDYNHDPDRRCHSACQKATGDKCECSCDGVNHGVFGRWTVLLLSGPVEGRKG